MMPAFLSLTVNLILKFQVYCSFSALFCTFGFSAFFSVASCKVVLELIIKINKKKE